MYLIKIRHAGVVLDIVQTDDPEVWDATEGKDWRNRYGSAQITVMYLGTEQAEPQASKSRSRGASKGE